VRTIQIVNQSTIVTAAAAQAAVAAIQLQLSRDFAPLWGISANVVLLPVGSFPTGEAVYILDDSTQADALGFHTETITGYPEGFAFAKTAIQDGIPWEVVFDHEVLEQLMDPLVNLLVFSVWQNKTAGIAYEVCDPVEESIYLINGVPMSDFITPWWFGGPYPPGARFDFLGVLNKQLTMSPGGYVAYTTDLAGWQEALGDKFTRTLEKFSRHHRRHNKVRK
jgi:hypothetical protein